MFDKERFIAACRSAVAGDDGHKRVRELVAEVVAEPAAVMASLGEPERGEIQTLYRGGDLTIFNVLWAPHMMVAPHDHNTWAVIGVYTGREDNIFWRRLGETDAPGIEAAGARSMGPSDTMPMGRDIIHSVVNPTTKITGAIHIYGGDFFAVDRIEWEPENLRAQAYDTETTRRRFEAGNALLPTA